MVSWELDIISTQNFFNENSFDEGFPCDNFGLERSNILKHAKIFQDSRTQWSAIRYVKVCYVYLKLFLSIFY